MKRFVSSTRYARQDHEGGGSQPDFRGRRFSGFTTVELLVATVVMAFTLLGVYGVLRQGLFVEETVTSRWRDRAEAARIADYIVETIEQTVRLEGYSSLSGGPTAAEAGFELTGIRSGELFSSADPVWATHRRYRLVWGRGEGTEGQLFLQTIPMAGSVDLGLSPRASEDGEFDEAQRWGLVPSTLIGEGLSRLQVQFRPVGSSNADWMNRWSDADTPPLVRVRVEVRSGDEAGGYTAERYVTPRATDYLIGGSDASSRRRELDSDSLLISFHGVVTHGGGV